MKQYFKNIIISIFKWLGFEPIKKEIDVIQLEKEIDEEVCENPLLLTDYPLTVPLSDSLKKNIGEIKNLNKILEEEYPLASYKFDVSKSIEAYQNAKIMETKFRAYRGVDPEIKRLQKEDDKITRKNLDEQYSFLRRRERNKLNGNKIRWNAHLYQPIKPNQTSTIQFSSFDINRLIKPKENKEFNLDDILNKTKSLMDRVEKR